MFCFYSSLIIADDRLVRLALQRWFARVCDDAVIQKDDELRNFIESDFGVSQKNKLSISYLN